MAFACHKHVVRWITAVKTPATIVDLGAGTSTFCFSDCAAQAKLTNAKIYAFDSYAGDRHSGFEHSLAAMQKRVAGLGAAGTNIVLTDPIDFGDAAAAWPAECKIDILHLDDGVYAKDTVRRHLDAWLPHLADDGAILLHGAYTHLTGCNVHEAINALLDEGDAADDASDTSFKGVYFEQGLGLGILTRDTAFHKHIYGDYHKLVQLAPVHFPLTLAPIAAADKDVSIHAFYHVCAVYNFADVMREQIATLQSSGLYDRMHTLFVSIVSKSLNDIERARDLLKPLTKVRIVYLSTDPTCFERPLLEFMHKFAFQFTRDAAMFLYLHTKGVSQQHQKEPTQSKIADWRKMMQYFLIEQHTECIDALRTHAIAGVNWRTWPQPHFAGNFWWARSDYLTTLAPKIGPDYYDSEMWIGSRRPRMKELHHTDLDHYFAPYPRSEYVSVVRAAEEQAALTANITLILQKTIDLFNKHNIEYWLAYGTLLGYRRDGAVIPHDDDADMCANGVQFTKILALRDECLAVGLHIVSFGKPQDYRKIIQFRTHDRQKTVDKDDDTGFIDVYCVERRENICVDHWNGYVVFICYLLFGYYQF
jgi:hypothetical protein